MEKSNSSRSFGAYIKENKVSVIIVSVIVAAIVAVSIVLGVLLSSTFRIGRLEKIYVGDHLRGYFKPTVEEIMGTPDIETDEACEYYESSVVDDIKAFNEALEKGNLNVAERRSASLQGKTFKYIRITFGYKEYANADSTVSEVFYDANCKFYDGKLVHGDKTVKEFELKQRVINGRKYDEEKIECVKTVNGEVISYTLVDDISRSLFEYTTIFTDGSYIRAVADVSFEIVDRKPYLVWSDRFTTYKDSSLIKIVNG